MTIENCASEIGRVLSAVEALSEAERLSRPVAARICLVLDELLSNIIDHGFESEGGSAISIRLSLQAEGVVGELVDAAKPFSPDDVPAPDTSLGIEDRPLGGLGLHLVRSLTKSLTYRREDGRNHQRFVIELTA